MTKPRIFVSSTYYDLKHIRSSLESFIENMGYEPILFENGDIPYNYKLPLDESCYGEIKTAHMFILIIGGRYGSPSSETIEEIDEEEHEEEEEDEGKIKQNCNNYNSVTVKEYITALKKDIPIFIFVEKNVYSEYRTYKENRNANCQIKYAYVDHVNVFKLLDKITRQERNNPIRDFDKFEDISNWLRDQWAGMFADYLLMQQGDKSLEGMSTKIEELSQVTATLRKYTESIMRKVDPEHSEETIKKQTERMDLLNKKQFLSNDLIDFIRYADVNTNNDGLYSAFKKAKTLDEFLEAIEYPDQLKDELLKSENAINMYEMLLSNLLEEEYE